jgi:hypothetical protein
MKTLLRAVVVALAALATAAGVFAQQKPKTRRIYMTVVDPSNTPVLDLTAADFQLKENDVSRTVTRAAINQPVRIALMADNSDAVTSALTPLRAGLQAFIDAIPPQHEIVLLTTGRQLRVRVPPSTDHKKLKDAVGLIYPDAGSPSVLLSGITETFNRFFRDVPDRWATMVIVTSDGPENSNMNPKQFNQLADALTARDMLIHGIVLSTRGLGMQADATITLAKNSGGHVDTLTVPNGLAERMKALGVLVAQDAEALSRQYQIDYNTESTGPQATVEIIISRAGLRPVVSQGRPTR